MVLRLLSVGVKSPGIPSHPLDQQHPLCLTCLASLEFAAGQVTESLCKFGLVEEVGGAQWVCSHPLIFHVALPVCPVHSRREGRHYLDHITTHHPLFCPGASGTLWFHHGSHSYHLQDLGCSALRHNPTASVTFSSLLSHMCLNATLSVRHHVHPLT